MLTVVRHGRTTANASGLLLGRADPDLDDVGRAQAEALAATLAALADAEADLVLRSSPLRRARQTAEAIASALGDRPVVVDDRWVELDYGAYDGEPVSSVPAEVWA